MPELTFGEVLASLPSLPLNCTVVNDGTGKSYTLFFEVRDGEYSDHCTLEDLPGTVALYGKDGSPFTVGVLLPRVPRED